jgi:hypothetical protein
MELDLTDAQQARLNRLAEQQGKSLPADAASAQWMGYGS